MPTEPDQNSWRPPASAVSAQKEGMQASAPTMRGMALPALSRK